MSAKGKTIARQLSVRSLEHYKAYSLQYSIVNIITHPHACFLIMNTMNVQCIYLNISVTIYVIP